MAKREDQDVSECDLCNCFVTLSMISFADEQYCTYKQVEQKITDEI